MKCGESFASLKRLSYTTYTPFQSFAVLVYLSRRHNLAVNRFQTLFTYTIVYRKESFLSKESDTKDLQEYCWNHRDWVELQNEHHVFVTVILLQDNLRLSCFPAVSYKNVKHVFWTKPGIPNLDYICLSEGVHLRLAMSQKIHWFIIYFQIFILYICQCLLFSKIVTWLLLNISMISHDKVFGKKSIKRVSNMFQFGTDWHSPRLLNF